MTHPRRPLRPSWERECDRGSMTTELVVLAPIVIVILLLVVGFGRYAHGKQLVEQAAAAAARAASLATTAVQGETRAELAAAGSLADAGLACAAMTADVDTGSFRPGGQVTVTRNAGAATAVVTADVLTVIPFATFGIHEEATSPTEEFVTAAGP